MAQPASSKRILCFGDSNTWGYIPGTPGERYDWPTRWPGVVQNELGSGYTLIEEALNGRTTVWDDPMKPNRNGSKQLPFILESHTPIDVVIIALGVNDLKHHFNLKAVDIALGVRTLAEMVQGSRAGRMQKNGVRRSPEVLLITAALPVDSPNPLGHKFHAAKDRGAGLSMAIAEVAEDLRCQCVDANEIVTIPDTDGIHLDEQAHADLGRAIATVLRSSV